MLIVSVFIEETGPHLLKAPPEKTQGPGEDSVDFRVDYRVVVCPHCPLVLPAPKQLPNKDLSRAQQEAQTLRPPHARAAGAPGASGARRT